MSAVANNLQAHRPIAGTGALFCLEEEGIMRMPRNQPLMGIVNAIIGVLLLALFMALLFTLFGVFAP
jgi:hypothetical protein